MLPRLFAMAALIRISASFTSTLHATKRLLPSLSPHLVAASSSPSSHFTKFQSSTSHSVARRTSGSVSHTMMSASAGSFDIAQIPCLDDNYGYLIHDPKSGQTAAVDTPCAKSYQRELEKRGWKLTHILNTHHHGDHVGGNRALKTEGVEVYGPASDGNIPCMDHPLGEGDSVEFGGAHALVMDVGGHTRGHIAFYFPQEKTAFVGDSLFSLGCGKMFEGTPKQFWASLLRLRELPDDTMVYSAHEYTESNARFAMSVEPGNADLVQRVEVIKAKRARGEPTVPSLMAEEKLTNPFLRGDVSSEIRKNVGASDDEDGAAIFHKIRSGKDSYRG